MENKINCLIVDDDETSRFVLSNLVTNLKSLNLVGTCENVKVAKEIIKEKDVDLLLLDIEMPEETGVDLIKQIDDSMDVIFITSQTKHAVVAFEYDAVDYIVKPVSFGRLSKAIDKVVRKNQAPGSPSEIENTIVIKSSRGVKKYSVKNILYIEAKSNYVTYHTTQNQITTTGVLKNMEFELDKSIFVRIHRSYIVNEDKIESVNKDSIVVSGETLPLSRKYKKNVVDRFKNKR